MSLTQGLQGKMTHPPYIDMSLTCPRQQIGNTSIGNKNIPNFLFFMWYVLQNVTKGRKVKMLRAQVETSVDWFLTITLKDE